MSFTVLDIDPTRYATQIDVQHTSGRPINASNEVLSDRCFGIDDTDTPYFDPAGATPGEVAPLAWDGSRGHFFLIRGYAADPHAMRLAQRRRLAARHTPPRPARDGQLALERTKARWRASGNRKRLARLEGTTA